MIRCLVPKHLVFQAVGGDVVADDQTFVVLRALIHELTEHLKRGEHARVVLIDNPSVARDVLAQNEDEVHVGAQVGANAERILHRNHGREVNMASVHEDELGAVLVHPRLRIVEAVVQNQKGAGVNGGAPSARNLVLVPLVLDGRLTLDHVLDNLGAILVVNELGRNHVLEELVGNLGGADHRADGKARLCIEEDIAHQERLAGILLPDDDHHGGLA